MPPTPMEGIWFCTPERGGSIPPGGSDSFAGLAGVGLRSLGMGDLTSSTLVTGSIDERQWGLHSTVN